jgi:protein SCO1
VKRRFFWFFVSLVAAATGCTNRASKLPDYGEIPHFTMTDSSGRPFDSGELKGKVWIVDFIYTNCPGPCPRMTSQMHKVEQKVLGKDDVRLVSISVDPENDTPPILSAFAHKFGGPTAQWMFLTGSPQTIHLLAHDVFHIGDVIQKMDHSTKFMLVDKRGTLRGYYSSSDEGEISSMLEDLEVLQHQPS